MGLYVVEEVVTRCVVLNKRPTMFLWGSCGENWVEDDDVSLI